MSTDDTNNADAPRRPTAAGSTAPSADGGTKKRHAAGKNVTDAKPIASVDNASVAHALGCCNLFTRQWRNGIRDDRLIVTVQQIRRHLENAESTGASRP